MSNNHLLTMATRIDPNKKPSVVYKKRDRPLCTHCGLNGYTVDTCYKLHGYPPGYKPKPRISKPNPVNMVQLKTVTIPLGMNSRLFFRILILSSITN